jgi:hypothetical protein
MDFPTSWTKCALFSRWLDECGWTIMTDAIGCTTIPEKDDVAAASRIRYCLWESFIGVWKKDYAALIIPKSREDICGDGFIFMNAYKYKKAMPQKIKDGLTSDEEDEDDVVADVDEREAGIAKAYKYVKNAQKQRSLFNLKVEEARSDAALMVPHRIRRYCLGVRTIVKTWHSLTLVVNNLVKPTTLAHWASTVLAWWI